MEDNNIYKHRRATYEKALSIIHAVNMADNALTQIGIVLDYDDGQTPIGAAMGILLKNPEEIVCEALDLTLRTEEAHYSGEEGRLIPIPIDVYYPSDGDLTFSITYDELWTMIGKAAEEPVFAERLWACFADKDKESLEFLKQASASGWAILEK